MNRAQRRKARRVRVGHVVNVSIGRFSIGRFLTADEQYECFICGNVAKDWPLSYGPGTLAHGIARIDDRSGRRDVPLCETCFNSGDVSHVIVRKVWQAPDLEIRDGGTKSDEEIAAIAAALANRQDATEH